MIVAKTKMVRVPETCKKCSKAIDDVQGKWCSLTGNFCPHEKKPSGNTGYGMPTWCPLMDIDFLED